MSKNASAFSQRLTPSTKLYRPGSNLAASQLDVGLNLVDLKTQAATLGNPNIPLAGFTTMTVSLVEVISGTTPGAGSATIDLALFDEDATQISEFIPLGTLAFGDAAGTFRKIVGLGGFAASVNGANFTVGAGCDAIRSAAYGRFRINVTAAFTLATTATVSVYVAITG